MRLSYSKASNGGAEVLTENNFYPFGLKHVNNSGVKGEPSYNYGYNGKELQKETGWSDYGARMYMSDIGRWGVIDPLAEQYRRLTPYNYAANNPIFFIDPDGRKIKAPTNNDSGVSPYAGLNSMLNYLGPGNRTGILRFLGMEDNMGAYYILMGNVADSVGGGTTLTDPKDIAAFQQSLAAPDYFAGINFEQFMGANPMQLGLFAHRAMATFFYTDASLRENWFPEKTQSIWKWDLKMRPDLHYMNSSLNAVWELKPMSNFVDSSLSLRGKHQAQVYADALTMITKEKFFVGSSQGAPIPPINGRVVTDLRSGYQFSYTVPIGTDGMIYYNCLNCKDSKRDTVKQTQPQTANQTGTGLAVALLILNIAIRLIPN